MFTSMKLLSLESQVQHLEFVSGPSFVGHQDIKGIDFYSKMCQQLHS